MEVFIYLISLGGYSKKSYDHFTTIIEIVYDHSDDGDSDPPYDPCNH